MATRQQLHLTIADEFSKTPGPRSRAEGKHSAEEFLETILLGRFDEAVASDAILIVDLDGGYGYGTSFLEEAFGGLARLRTVQTVLDHIDFKSDEEPYLRDDVFTYIREALTGRSKKRL
jgi:hypothetical protein